ncbi:MAG TPA: class I SAM-dependent methyltransferase [Pirellulaceae bacterium]|jgi:SAM-dependent methyltransferase|nr:class I SAM-dependent methyltransferase [Pirellulaceae bacterium]
MIRALATDRGASLFDERYASAECYYGRSIRPELARFLHATCVSGWEALDLGCGEGRYAIALAERGCQVTAVDRSRVGVEKLAGAAMAKGLSIEAFCEDVTELDFGDEQYDLIVFSTILDHLSEPGRSELVEEIRRALRPGGVFFGCALTQSDPGYLCRSSVGVSETAGGIEHYFAPGELHRCFADFDVVKYDEFLEEDRSHGPVHDHGWAVILGRKPERRLVR